MIKFAYITTPRPLPTLSLSIESLREKGYNGTLYIFAEPGGLQINRIENAEIFIAPQTLGAMANFDRALQYMTDIANGDLIAVLQDDMMFCDRFMKYIADIATHERGFGYYNLFTNGWMPGIREICKAEGWNRIEVGWHTWGAMFLFDPYMVNSIRQHEFYQNHLAKKKKQIDGCISEVCRLMGLAMYVHNPSLSYTIGYISTMNHTRQVDGLNFR